MGTDSDIMNYQTWSEQKYFTVDYFRKALYHAWQVTELLITIATQENFVDIMSLLTLQSVFG